jgi:probable F420-dependent oxidoreductase
MRIGVVFPQTEIGADAGGIRAYAEAVESFGFTHVLSYDHVLGVDPTVREGFTGYYDVHSTFHEPFVLYGYLAGITTLELVTGIIILPQRQTALVAKQAAEVDILSGGRLRLGVAIGWNAVEYEALGKEFSDRGRRLEEQVALLRRLWTETTVVFEGTDERVVGAGIAPLPLQRPIPVWFGANTARALERAGRLADGWFPQRPPGSGLEEDIETVTRAALAAGRDPATIGMEGRVRYQPGEIGQIVESVATWQAAGATHLSIDTMNRQLGTVDAHVAALGEVAAALGLST